MQYPNVTMNVHTNDEVPTFRARPIAHNKPGSFLSFDVEVEGTYVAWFVNDDDEPLQELIANLQGVILEVEDIIDGVHPDFKEE